MKNLFIRLLFLTAAVMSFTSCSVTNDIVVSEDPTPYRYRKVYEGNRIIYRDVQSDRKLDLEDESLAFIEEDDIEMIIPLMEEGRQKETDRTLTADARESHPLIDYALGELYENAFKKDSRVSRFIEKTQAPQNSGDDTMALLGFIFSVLAILSIFATSPVFGLIGLAAGIAGMVLSILGLDSNNRVLAILGLIFSILYFVLLIIAVVIIASYL